MSETASTTVNYGGFTLTGVGIGRGSATGFGAGTGEATAAPAIMNKAAVTFMVTVAKGRIDETG